MKKILVTIPLLAFFVFSCTFFETIVGSGNLVEVQMSYEGFTALDIDAPFDVTLIHDTDYSVTIMVDDNILEYVEISQNNETLSIDLGPYSIYTNVSLKAVVTMPVLTSLALSSASTVTVINSGSFPGVTEFSATVAEASHLLISSVVANSMSVTVTGASGATVGVNASTSVVSVDSASTLKMNGSSYDLTLKVDRASDADLTDYAANSVSATVSAASEGWINVDGVLDADITGASSLYYRGTVTLGVLNIEGASSFIVY